MTLRSMLSQQVRRVLHSSGLSLAQLGQYFFQTFHTWFPVISPKLFFETALVADYDALAAEFSILVITMHLITERPRLGAAVDKASCMDMYVTVKVLFAHSMTVLPTSTALIQTGILITAYEYASGRPDPAFVSIGTCVRMAQTIGLATISTTKYSSIEDSISASTVLEERNLWWAIVILERYDRTVDFARYKATDLRKESSSLKYRMEAEFLQPNTRT
jgi:hypothetical protein